MPPGKASLQVRSHITTTGEMKGKGHLIGSLHAEEVWVLQEPNAFRKFSRGKGF